MPSRNISSNMAQTGLRNNRKPMVKPRAKPVRKPQKPETKRKIAQALKGRKKSDATKAKMREARLRYLASLSTEGGQ
jgi:hypothetical protein